MNFWDFNKREFYQVEFVEKRYKKFKKSIKQE